MTSRTPKLSLEEKLVRSPHFRALMESYWRYVDRHGMPLETGLMSASQDDLGNKLKNSKVDEHISR